MNVIDGKGVTPLLSAEERERVADRAHAEEILLDALAKLRAGEFDTIAALAIDTKGKMFRFFTTPTIDRFMALGCIETIKHRLLHLHEEE